MMVTVHCGDETARIFDDGSVDWFYNDRCTEQPSETMVRLANVVLPVVTCLVKAKGEVTRLLGILMDARSDTDSAKITVTQASKSQEDAIQKQWIASADLARAEQSLRAARERDGSHE